MTTDDWKAVRLVSRTLALYEEQRINEILTAVAEVIPQHLHRILEANQKDLSRMHPEDPKYDRLRLTEQRLLDIAADIRNVAALPSPLGRVWEESVRPNGLRLKKVSVPFGVIGIIYEARPNVTFDVFSLCLKSGSACVLKGGSDASESNRAIVDLLHQVLADFGVDPRVVTLLPPGREAAETLLHAREWVDLIIPRGSKGLIEYVRQNATVPVIETGAGVCHTYFDASGSLEKGVRIVNNAKTRRVSVCNALDCLLVHASRISELPALCAPLAENSVIIYADEPAFQALSGHYPAHLLLPALPDTYGTEFLDYKMAVKAVKDLGEAISHIYTYGSGHSECIVTEDKQAATEFCRRVDAACVYVNAPTSFTDGAQFGLGAEIGISTQKLHARGPMGLREITTYKWLIEGDGQIRP